MHSAQKYDHKTKCAVAEKDTAHGMRLPLRGPKQVHVDKIVPSFQLEIRYMHLRGEGCGRSGQLRRPSSVRENWSLPDISDFS